MLSLALARRAANSGLALACGVLVACSSVSLGPARREVPVASPPLPPGATARGSATEPLPSEPARPAPADAAQPLPVPGAALPAPVPLTSLPGDGPPPYGPAVAARFPDPPIDYRTPAFAAGHAGFTSNAELHRLLAEIVEAAGQRATGPLVELLDLGTSQAGTPLEALRFARRDGAGATGSSTVRGVRPTVLFIAQQHGDEPAGAEALIVVAQEIASGRLTSVLDHIDVVVMPRANPDGAEANRRTAVNGIDINRDHLLLRTPEAQAQARLMREFAPLVVVDAHEYSVTGRYLETFGAVQRYDALIQYAMTGNMPEFVTKAAEEWFRAPAVAQLRKDGLASEWYYTSSGNIGDKRLAMGGTLADTGRNVNGLTNAVSMLIETRGLGLGRLHLKRRVHTHVVAAASILHSAASRAGDLVKLRQFVDQEVSSKACQGELVVEAAPTPSEYRLTMLDPTTGADKAVVVNWDSALALRAVKVRPRPCGYWLAEQEADAAEHLRALGVQVLRIEEPGEVRGEAYREVGRESVSRPASADIADARPVVIKVQTVPALVDMKAGGYYVPLAQPLANLAAAALEPDTEVSFFAHRIVENLSGQARLLLPPQLSTSAMP